MLRIINLNFVLRASTYIATCILRLKFSVWILGATPFLCDKMKPLTTKQMIRLEKKKKKMEAFLEIAKLNDRDRETKQNQTNNNCNEESDSSSQLETGPTPKRLKSSPSSDNDSDEKILKDSIDSINKNMSFKEKAKFTAEQYAELKQRKRERNAKIKTQPRLRLKDMGFSASLATSANERIPIFLDDIQHLLMYSVLGHHSPYSPSRWCHIEKFNRLAQTVVLVVENVSLYHYSSYESVFTFLNASFENKVEIITPAAYKGNVVQELATVPLTSTQKNKLLKKYGNLETAALQTGEVFHMLRAIFPIKEKAKEYKIEAEKKPELPETDCFPRTQIVMSASQLVEEDYPLPLKGCLLNRYSDYVLTKDLYDEVTPFSPMFGLDCEMCRTTTGDLELTRISIVNEKLETIYEKLVKPKNKIVDYLTRYSGITPKMMQGVTTTLKDVQEDVRKLLPPDAILVGQSLNMDLKSMHMMHPYIIDTSVIFNITGERRRKSKLQTLAREFLCEKIQMGRKGHCSTEDSLASIKLVQLKLTKNIEFGDAVLCGRIACEKNMQEMQMNKMAVDSKNFNAKDSNSEQNRKYVSSLFNHVTKIEHTATVIGCEEVISEYTNYIATHLLEGDETGRTKVTCETAPSNKEVVKKACESFKESSLTLAHLRFKDEDVEHDNAPNTFRSINKWTKKMWDNLGPQSLFVVIFTGQNTGSGFCCLQIRRSNKQLLL